MWLQVGKKEGKEKQSQTKIKKEIMDLIVIKRIKIKGACL